MKKINQVVIDEVLSLPEKETIGYFAKDSDYDVLISEDTDVILPDGKKIVFRTKVFKDLIDSSDETFGFFKRVAKSLHNDGRGLAAGRELTDRRERRMTVGQRELFTKYLNKGKIFNYDEAIAIANAHPDPSLYMVFWKKLEKDDLPASPEWFNVWLRRWDEKPDEEKQAFAKASFGKYTETGSRPNRCYSNVLGAMDRSARIPYCRLTKPTRDNLEGFRNHKDVYDDCDRVLQATMEDVWHKQSLMTSQLPDEFCLFGTAFTSITVNWNFRLAYHWDGNNFEGGVGVLTALTRGEYEGHYLVFPELRIAFDLRDGDFLAGDTTNYIHGNTAMVTLTEDAQRVSLVFYCREKMANCESIECEDCRKQFIATRKELHKVGFPVGQPHPDSTNRKNWSGISPNMWKEKAWESYRKIHCPDAKDTNYSGT